MAVKDITDEQVCKAFKQAKEQGYAHMPYELLEAWTGQPHKVCLRAMQRACDRDLIEVGVSLRCGWLTPKGMALLEGVGAWITS